MSTVEKLNELFTIIFAFDGRDKTYTELVKLIMLRINKSDTSAKRLIKQAFKHNILQREVINGKGFINLKKEPKKGQSHE